MSKIDYQALRDVAVKAGKDKWQAKKINGDFFVIRHGSYTRQHGYTLYQPIAEIDCKSVRDFVAKANPATVLALLDELEAQSKRIAELEKKAAPDSFGIIGENIRTQDNRITSDPMFVCIKSAKSLLMLIMTMTGLSGLMKMVMKPINAKVVVSNYFTKTFESHKKNGGALL